MRNGEETSNRNDFDATIKAASLAIAIEKGIIDIDDEYDCENGRWLHAGKYLKDWKNFKSYRKRNF